MKYLGYLAIGIGLLIFLGKKEYASQVLITKLNLSSSVDTVAVVNAWYLRLRELGFEFPEVVTAQMVHETAYLTSKIYVENNNLFGMKKRKKGFAIGVLNGHAAYKDRADSLRDYLAYQRMILRLARAQHYVISSTEDYFWLLEHLPHCTNCRYAEDMQYITKLRKHMEFIKNLSGENSRSLGIVY